MARTSAEQILPAAQDDRPLADIETSCTLLGGVSRQTLYRLIADGELNLVKVRARSFVRLSEIRSFIARQAERAS